MYSTDPIALNERLERRAQRSIFNPNYGNEVLQEDLLDIARGCVLGDVTLEVRQRADELFLRAEMGRVGRMNRIQRYFHIHSTGQASRLLGLSENPDLGTELSRRVAREYRADQRRAIVVSFSALISVCFWIWSQRPSANLSFG